MLKDQQERLSSLKEALGNPSLTSERLVELNNSVFVMRFYCEMLGKLDFKDFDAMKEWL